MKKILLISLSMLFAGEMEVDGSLTVTEGVNASSFSGDGSALTNLPSLGGMQPERIYIIRNQNLGTLTTPSDKMWVVSIGGNGECSWYDDEGYSSIQDSAPTSIILKTNWTMNFSSNCTNAYILEYPISGSGTDQGMDYIVP